MGRPKSLSHDGPLEERFFQQNRNPARDGAHNRGSVGGTCMIRGKQAHARGDVLQAFHANFHANGADKKHYAFHARPINRIGIARDEGVDEQRRPDDQDIQGQENANEKSAQHRQANFLESRGAGQANRGTARTLANTDGTGFAAKHSLSNVPRLFVGVGILAHHVKSLLDFAEPEFDCNLLVLAPNP